MEISVKFNKYKYLATTNVINLIGINKILLVLDFRYAISTHGRWGYQLVHEPL
jgi:hypothetical protein